MLRSATITVGLLFASASAFGDPLPRPEAKGATRPSEPAEAKEVEKPGSLPTDVMIAALIVQASRASYVGNCPCPYDTDRAGRNCGRRSAYSKPNGREPFCYSHDVTAAMIEVFRRHNRNGTKGVPTMLLDRKFTAAGAR